MFRICSGELGQEDMSTNFYILTQGTSPPLRRNGVLPLGGPLGGLNAIAADPPIGGHRSSIAGALRMVQFAMCIYGMTRERFQRYTSMRFSPGICTDMYTSMQFSPGFIEALIGRDRGSGGDA